MPKPALFVYGTLHPDRAPREIAEEVKRMVRIGEGTIRGHLDHTADYPAVRIGPGLTQSILGTVFEIPDDPAFLARLDAYEDFRPDDPANSLFVRKLIEVTLNDGNRRTCWIYVYNRPAIAAGAC